ncbi:hypothetical protein [Fischerella sp. PCC 9605]|uniref:hypothetical protein n=1 Tax=Fischerella sp. PCC 9605 TaxID=1173024 RepID=UPI00047DFF38|nr:hypothetical protein [Fischerella sp. PCC 9605]
MFHSFSIHKSIDAFKVLAAGVVSSLLAVQLSPTIAQRVDQSATLLADSNSTTPIVVTEQVSKPTLWLIAAGAVGGGIAVSLALRERENNKGSTTDSFSFEGKQTSIFNLDQGSRKLQRKLLNLLHDDREAAKRLLTQAKLKNPNRTTDWYFEKVIYDLERDRGGL